MTTSDDRIAPPVPELSHVAFVVDDLEAGMRRFDRLLGIGPWLLYRYESPRFSDRTFRGEPEPYSMRVALSDVGGPVDKSTNVASPESLGRFVAWLADVRDRLFSTVGLGTGGEYAGTPKLPNPGLPGVNVELIEPLDGRSTYTEHLETGGTGIHHVGCFAYDDPAAAVESYVAAGIPVVQAGRFEGVQFWYLDLREELDGVLLEVAANLEAIPAPDGVYPE